MLLFIHDLSINAIGTFVLNNAAIRVDYIYFPVFFLFVENATTNILSQNIL